MVPSDPSSSLSTLARRYGSDKTADGRQGHGYVRVYEALLGSLRDRPLRILEIGLLHPQSQLESVGKSFERCPSLDMWADFAPRACVYGLDLEDFSAYRRPGVVVLQCDQGDRSALTEAVRTLGAPFDLIVEDGSHASHHQQVSLGTLFPFVRPGGWYAIEDLQWQPAALEREGILKTRDLLSDLSLGDLRSGATTAMRADEIEYLRSHAGEMMFFDSLRQLNEREPLEGRDALCVIQKKAGSASETDARASQVGQTSAILQRISRCAHSWTSTRDLWVWGAGSGGRRVLALLRQRGIEVAGVIDSDPRRVAKVIDEHRIHSPGALTGAGAGRPFVLVASDYAAAIRKQIQELGLSEGLDFVAAHFGAVADLEAAS